MKKPITQHNKKFSLLNALLVFIAVCLCNFLYAQPSTVPTGLLPTGTTTTTTGGTPCFGTQCIPIDTGIIFLLVTGTLLGLRFLYQLKHRQST